MERIDLEVEIRDVSGKGPARQIRRSGRIPAVLNGRGKSISLVVDPSLLLQVMHSESGENALINLKMKKGDGKESTVTAILRDFQKDPVTGELLHADLFEVSMTKEIRVRAHLVMEGEAPGVKTERGVLQHNLRDLEIECLPSAIPDHIVVDISKLGVGESIHVRDLLVPEGVKVIDSGDQTIVSVAAPISDEKLESMLASAPTEGEVVAPEVTIKGKEKEGAEGEAPEEKSADKPGSK